MTDNTPTPDSVFKSNPINASILRQLIERVNRELLTPVWVEHHAGYLVDYNGITGLTEEVFYALERHYRKYGWAIGIHAGHIVFTPI